VVEATLRLYRSLADNQSGGQDDREVAAAGLNEERTSGR
jgi:hypothetical protein